jgi:flavin reductase (DIM6/NTAB) family NADH-FMN oxidoreductase RutF
MIFDTETMAHEDAYRLIVGAVLPRPIAFVSTLGPTGVANLAPYSFFTVVCASPLTICFSAMRRGQAGSKKDTLLNIEANGEFVVNVVDESFVQQMNAASADFEHGVSEFEQTGLTPIASTVVAPPRVLESPINMECRVHQLVAVSDQPGGGTLVLGRVVRMHIRDDLLAERRIVTERWQPLGRLAGATYARVSDRFDLPRPAPPPQTPVTGGSSPDAARL